MDCLKHHYTDNGFQKKTMLGQIVPRSKDARVPLPCVNCPKIPDGVSKTRFQAIDFTKQTWDAYQYYLRCKAIGNKFPDDEAIEQVALVVSQVEEECTAILEARRRSRELTSLALVLKNG